MVPHRDYSWIVAPPFSPHAIKTIRQKRSFLSCSFHEDHRLGWRVPRSLRFPVYVCHCTDCHSLTSSQRDCRILLTAFRVRTKHEGCMYTVIRILARGFCRRCGGWWLRKQSPKLGFLIWNTLVTLWFRLSALVPESVTGWWNRAGFSFWERTIFKTECNFMAIRMVMQCRWDFSTWIMKFCKILMFPLWVQAP